MEAVVGILVGLDKLISFPCVAVDEVRAKLREMLDNRGGLAVGKYDGDVSDLETFISLQYEHRHDPDFFEARWRSLKTHPNRKSRKAEWQAVRKIAEVDQRHDLTLSDFHAIRYVLSEVHGSAVILRNPAVNPADFSSKKAYEDALAEHYATVADILRDPKTNYHFYKDASYLENLQQALDDLPLVLAVSSYYPVKQKLETYELKNVVALKRLTNNQIRFYVSRDVRRGKLKCKTEKEDKKGKYQTVERDMYYIVAALWRPDGWQPTYNEWRKYGRDALKSLPNRFK